MDMTDELNSLFHKITMEDKERFDEALSDIYIEACDYVFANNIMWAECYHTEVAYLHDCLLIKYSVNGEIMFAYPMSSDRCKRINCVKLLIELCDKEKISLKFTLITEEIKKELLSEFRGIFETDAFRDGFDYVYERERLERLPGSKLAAKRNHINRFNDRGNWEYEVIDKNNIDECLKLEYTWLSSQPDEDKQSLNCECDAIRFAFEHFTELGLSGGAIRQNGRIAAFSVGERLNRDTFVVHFEKADVSIRGAYQIINQQFAEHNPEYKYFNREDDTGDLGLRKSKMSYHPDFMVKKYIAVKSDFSYATYEDREDIITLWEICFGDSREYIEFFFEHMVKEDTVLCRRHGGKVVSMACIIPAKIRGGGKCEKINYLYAVATLPEYRKQGMATSIINHIYEKCGCSLVLCPENVEAESLYKKMGFCEAFHGVSNMSDYTGGGTPEDFVEICDVTDECAYDYQESRRVRFADRAYVDWDDDYIRYALEEHINTGGRMVKCRDGYVLFKVSESGIIIAENTVSAEYEDIVLTGLETLSGNQRVSYEKNMGMYKKGTNEDCCEHNDGYIALTLG